MDSVAQPLPENEITLVTTSLSGLDHQPPLTGIQAEQQTEVIYTRLNTGQDSLQGSNSNDIQQIPSSTCTSVSTESDTVRDPSASLPTTSVTGTEHSVLTTSGTNIVSFRLPSTLAEGESNFLRFCHLVQKVAPQAVRCRFDQEFPPDQLNAIIQRNMTLLMELKDKRVLTKAQWKLILPYGAQVTSTNFDVTLMICFFRHLSSIAPKYCDYDTLPPTSDESLGADLARIKYYRNYISHCLEKERKMDCFEYPICWETVSKAVSRIGGHQYELECSNLLVGTLDQSYMDVYRNFQMEKAELTEKMEIQEKKLEAQREKLDVLELQLKDVLPPHMRENIRSMMDQWKIRDKSFVETETSKYISKVMKADTVIIVTGTPGCGKSFTVQHVLLLLKHEGYDVIPVTTSSDMVKYFSRISRQVFYIDNIAGKYNISSNDIEDFQRNKEQIDTMFKCSLTKFIFTCRLQIYNDPMFNNLHLDNFKVCNFSGDHQISQNEKILISKQYLPENVVKDLNVDTISKCDCFPLLCSLYESHAHEGTLFFEQPKTYIEKEMYELKISPDKIKYTCLALCVMYNDLVPFEIFTIQFNFKAKQIFDVVFEECEVNLSTSKKTVLTQFESMVGSFFTKTETGYRSIHDYMFDIYCDHFGSNMLECIVEYADSGLISDRAVLQSTGPEYISDILIPEYLEKKFFQRIKQDIIDRKIWDVFSAFQLKFKSYRLKLIEVLKSLEHINYDQDGITPLFVISSEGYLDILNLLVCKGGDVNLCNKYGESPLHIASCKGHKDCVDFLLNKGANPNKCDIVGVSPLYEASLNGHTTILEMLYNKGGEVNLCSEYEGSRYKYIPLYIASQRGYKDCVDFLLKKGADVNNCDNDGTSSVHVASEEGHTAILEMLCNRGGDVNLCKKDGASPLCIASEKGHTTILEILYNSGGDVNLCRKDGASPLYIALCNGHKDCVEFLLNKEVDVNKCNSDGFSPMYTASEKGHTNILEMLYNRGGDVNLCSNDGRSPLYVASCNGHTDCIEFLLNNGVEVNKCDKYGLSPLYVASRSGHSAILEMLYSRGGDVYLCNKIGTSPLHIASYNGHTDCVEFLLNKNVNVNECGNDGSSPLYMASEEGHITILEMLYSRGGDVNLCSNDGRSPLYVASQNGHTTILKMLYNRGGDVNLCSNDGRSPLYAASYHGRKDCVDFLLNKGVEVNTCNNDGFSPLYAASEKGHTTILQMLFNRGGDVNLSSNDGRSPLYAASYNGQKDCVDFLLNKGVEVNKCDNDGLSPLYVASQKGHTTILKMLYNRGGDVNLCNKYGASPLYTASYNGHKDCVDFLLNKGVEVNKCNNVGFSPLYIASHNGHITILEMLYKRGGDVNLCNKDGESPLYVASQNGHTTILEMLYDIGLDVNMCNKNGESPLYVASQNGHTTTLEILYNRGGNVNLCDKDGQSPLYIASQNGHTTILEMLYNRGGDINLCNKDGESPLYTAALNNQTGCVDFLVDKGGTKKKCDNDGSYYCTVCGNVGRSRSRLLWARFPNFYRNNKQ